MKLQRLRQRGFTLIELMIVIGIIVIMLGVGVPAFVRSTRQVPLKETVNELMEGLKQARATAILSGVPTDLMINLESRSISLQRVAGEAVESAETRMGNAAPTGFQGHVHEEVSVEMLDVNLRDQLEAGGARVRFHPNGTSDEFTIVLRSLENEWRKISLETITGLPILEVDASKFMKQ